VFDCIVGNPPWTKGSRTLVYKILDISKKLSDINAFICPISIKALIDQVYWVDYYKKIKNIGQSFLCFITVKDNNKIKVRKVVPKNKELFEVYEKYDLRTINNNIILTDTRTINKEYRSLKGCWYVFPDNYFTEHINIKTSNRKALIYFKYKTKEDFKHINLKVFFDSCKHSAFIDYSSVKYLNVENLLIYYNEDK